jgi:hypothetical protein
MKTLITILFPLLLIGQQKETLNFHLLSEFAIKTNDSKKKKLNGIYPELIQIDGDKFSYYEITKIDSLGNYYLIEAKNNKYIYRIASIKRSKLNCKNIIREGKIYQLDLRSMDDNNLRVHINPNYSSFST